MRITKYLHSCLLVEDHGKRLLVDPGNFTFIEGLVRIDDIPHIDVILITHAHRDHAEPAIIRAITERDGAEVVGNLEIAVSLGTSGIVTTPMSGCDVSIGGFRFCATPAKHETTLGPGEPENTAYLVNDRLLLPGDSLSEELLVHKGVEILALPVTAPWGDEPRIAEFAFAISPKHVVPMHDGYVKPFFQEMMYERYAKVMEKNSIVFHRLLKPGESVIFT
jgi:L-ascorbate metabolism protein UlaG (beta-lactamase superfamily)